MGIKINISEKVLFREGKNIVQSFIRDITERKKGEEQLKVALKEKEVLLKEIHHRVKNNLEIISSLIRLQSRDIKDKKSLKILKNIENRVY